MATVLVPADIAVEKLKAALRETLHEAVNWLDDARSYKEGDETENPEDLGWITRAKEALTLEVRYA